jgi:hypothetical protein
MGAVTNLDAYGDLEDKITTKPARAIVIVVI